MPEIAAPGFLIMIASKEKKRAPLMCTPLPLHPFLSSSLSHLPHSLPPCFLLFPPISYHFPSGLINAARGCRCAPRTILRLLVPIGRCLRAIYTTMITFRQLTLNLRAEGNSHSENLSRKQRSTPTRYRDHYRMECIPSSILSAV